MTSSRFSPNQLIAFLDEALAPAEMAAIETALRADPALVQLLTALRADREMGEHSLGAIWRRRRLACPSRERLGSYLLGVLGDAESRFIKSHLELVACRQCRANAEDLASRQTEAPAASAARQRKFFDSISGRLPRPAK